MNSNVSRRQVSYHEVRAEEELELAQKADRPAVVRAHMELAELHLALLADEAADAVGEQLAAA